MDDPTDKSLAWVGMSMLISVGLCAGCILLRKCCVLRNTDVYTQLDNGSPV